AREVRADAGQLGALADGGRQVLARQQRLDPLHHGEVQVAQDGLRDRPGPWLVRGPLGELVQARPGSLAPRVRPRPAPASRGTIAPPGNADVTGCLTMTFASRVPRFE